MGVWEPNSAQSLLTPLEEYKIIFFFVGNIDRRSADDDTSSSIHGSNCLKDADCSVVSYCKRETGNFESQIFFKLVQKQKPLEGKQNISEKMIV
jgi:hypothetical protein